MTISADINQPARAGEVVNIEISAQMEDQWKIYSIYKLSDGPLPTEITISGEAVGTLDRVREPTPKHSFDPGFDTETYYHQGNTKFIFPFRVKRNIAPGTYQ